ncbi:hypothetical protein NL676_029864 [Syzygium grande]|nr:hypothetical protein NL676_029864 [Syzygium grande]
MKSPATTVDVGCDLIHGFCDLDLRTCELSNLSVARGRDVRWGAGVAFRRILPLYCHQPAMNDTWTPSVGHPIPPSSFVRLRDHTIPPLIVTSSNSIIGPPVRGPPPPPSRPPLSHQAPRDGPPPPTRPHLVDSCRSPVSTRQASACRDRNAHEFHKNANSDA